MKIGTRSEHQHATRICATRRTRFVSLRFDRQTHSAKELQPSTRNGGFENGKVGYLCVEVEDCLLWCAFYNALTKFSSVKTLVK